MGGFSTCEAAAQSVYGFPLIPESMAVYFLGFVLVTGPAIVMWLASRVSDGIRAAFL